MFAKANRFSFKNKVPGNVNSSPFFVVRHGIDTNTLQCAVIVGKKVSKKATVRNRLKRKIVTDLKSMLTDKTKLILVVYAKKGLNEANFSEASESLKEIINKIK